MACILMSNTTTAFFLIYYHEACCGIHEDSEDKNAFQLE